MYLLEGIIVLIEGDNKYLKSFINKNKIKTWILYTIILLKPKDTYVYPLV